MTELDLDDLLPKKNGGTLTLRKSHNSNGHSNHSSSSSSSLSYLNGNKDDSKSSLNYNHKGKELDPIIPKQESLLSPNDSTVTSTDKYNDEYEYDYNDDNKKKTALNTDGNKESAVCRSKGTTWMIHVALISVQVIFGTSSIVGALGLPKFHPLTFALVRESCATLLLLAVAHVLSLKNRRPRGAFGIHKVDVVPLMISGLGVFGGQAFYIIGVKLAGAVPASVWQPATPIVTSTLCMTLGWESLQWKRVGGILFAFSGCAYMVLASGNDKSNLVEGADDTTTNTTTDNAWGVIAGHVCFLLNTLGVSLYVMSSKRILATKRYEYITVTAWSYFVATICMAVSAVSCSYSQKMTSFVCPDCVYEELWHIPRNAIPALVWFILLTSATAYALIMWANQHSSPTLVTGYTVLQPVITDVVVIILLHQTVFQLSETSRNILSPPDSHAVIGAAAVIVGLLVMISTEPSNTDNKPNTTPFITSCDKETKTNNNKNDSIQQKEQGSSDESMTLLLEMVDQTNDETKNINDVILSIPHDTTTDDENIITRQHNDPESQ